MFPKQLNSQLTNFSRTGITGHLIMSVVVLIGGYVLFAFGLDLLGLPVSLGIIGPLTIGFFCFLYFFFRCKGSESTRRKDIIWDWWELSLFIIISLGILAYCSWLGLPSELPVGATVDAVHQYGIADYIKQHDHLPLHAYEAQANLQDGLAYPPAFALLVVLISQFIQIDPIYLMYPLSAFLAAMTTGTVFAIVSLLLVGKYWRFPVAGLAAGFSLVPFGYTFGSFTSQNYFAQVFGQALLLFSLYLLLLWRKTGQPLSLVLLAIALATLVITYPTWALVPAAAFGFTTLIWKELNWRARIKRLAQVVVPVGLVALLFLKDRLQTGLGTVTNEGAVLLPDLSRYSYAVLALALLGLEISLFIGKPLARLVTVFSGLFIVEAVSIWILKNNFSLGSFYSYYKMFYPAVFLIAILAAIGIDFLLECVLVLAKKNNFPSGTGTHQRITYALSMASGIVLFGLFLSMTWLNHPAPERPYAVITDDTFNVATWMKSNLKIEEYSVAYNMAPGTPAYWLQVGIFKQPRDVHAKDLLSQPPLTFENWFYSADSPPYLVTDNLSRIKLDERITVLHRSGQAAVITRSSNSSEGQQEKQNHLTIQYNSALQQNLLELRAEATMSVEPTHWLRLGLEITPLATGNNQPPLWKAILPAEEGRLKTQFLGLSVDLATLKIKEFYSNNNFPLPPATVNLPPGHYIANLVLQKEDKVVERRKLLEFTYNGTPKIEYDFAGGALNGQFVFDSLPPKPLPLVTDPIKLNLNDDQVTLSGLSVPTSGQVGQIVQIELLFELTKPVVRSYLMEESLLDQAGQVVSSSQFIPQDGLYPTWMWSIEKQNFILPTLKLPDKQGQYQLVMNLIDPSTGKKSDLVGLNTTIEVVSFSK